MNSIEAMRRRDELDLKIRRLQEERNILDRGIREDESREWIRVNRITPDRVQLSSGDDMPWHFTIIQFVEWLRTQPTVKPYVEWNGRVYLTSDFMSGNLTTTPGLMEHVV